MWPYIMNIAYICKPKTVMYRFCKKIKYVDIELLEKRKYELNRF